MKKRILSVFLAAALILCGCQERPADIVNADDYCGIGMETDAVTANTAAEIPDIVTAGTTGSETSSEATSTASQTTLPPVTTPQITTTKPPATTTTQRVTTPAETTTKKPKTTTTKAETTTTEKSETTVQIVIPSGTNSYKAVNYDEVKGVWISYIELSSLLTGKSKSQFTSNIKSVYKNCTELGINTVYVHARAFGDAFYDSDYYPWTKYASGTIGVAPGFDPLEIMVEQAHAYGLSFQAWINPFRICANSDISKVSSSYKIGKWYSSSATNGDYVVRVDNYWYLNPGYSECISLIASGVGEIVANYDVDGVHIDDYFYPTTDTSFDAAAYKKSGFGSLSGFRLANCDNLVKTLYNTVKNTNSSAIFGVSTQGNIDNNYNYMYADVEKWCSESGYVDYMAPQIYFGFKNTSQPFQSTLEKWQKMLKGTSIKLIPGLAVYKIGATDTFAGDGKNEWTTDTEIIKRQILASRETANYGGVILYSYDYVFNPKSYASKISAEMTAVKAVF